MRQSVSWSAPWLFTRKRILLLTFVASLIAIAVGAEAIGRAIAAVEDERERTFVEADG